MAGFKTHITVSTLFGAAYGAAGYAIYQTPPALSAVAAGLCGIAGILPDVDSDSGQSVREVMGFAATVIPLLLLDQLRQYGLSPDALVLAGASIYIVIRFGLSGVLRRFTVHRGMWHSIPAAIVAGLVTLFICSSDSTSQRVYKAVAVVLGYLTHLLLDELYSVQWYHGRFRLKKSFGTALKFWGPDPWANIAIFGKMSVLVFFLLRNPANPVAVPMNEAMGPNHSHETARTLPEERPFPWERR